MANLPVAWEYRTYYAGPDNPGWGQWERLEPRHEYSTIWDRVNELNKYIQRGNPYEIRPLYSADQRDRQTKLTTDQIAKILPGGIYDCLGDPWDEGVGDGDISRSIKTDVERIVRAVELAHGICDSDVKIDDTRATSILLNKVVALEANVEIMRRVLLNISLANSTPEENRKAAAKCLETISHL